MRTNNAKVKNTLVSIYFVLIVLVILLATLSSIFSHLTSSPVLVFLLILTGFLILFISVHSVSKYFEYDSDGKKVLLINRGLLLSDYFKYREHELEFDKSRLKAFRFKNYIVYKSLTLYVRNSKGHVKKETFNVTLVTKRKRRYIRQSLSKMIKNNSKSTN